MTHEVPYSSSLNARLAEGKGLTIHGSVVEKFNAYLNVFKYSGWKIIRLVAGISLRLFDKIAIFFWRPIRNATQLDRCT